LDLFNIYIIIKIADIRSFGDEIYNYDGSRVDAPALKEYFSSGQATVFAHYAK
jgi:hypothetical protein